MNVTIDDNTLHLIRNVLLMVFTIVFATQVIKHVIVFVIRFYDRNYWKNVQNQLLESESNKNIVPFMVAPTESNREKKKRP